MICSKCGKECDDNVKFCTECGAELDGAGNAQTEESVAEGAEKAALEESQTSSDSGTETEPAQKTEKAEEKKAVKDVKEKKPVNKNILKVCGIIAAVLVVFLLGKAIFSGSESYMTSGKKAILVINRLEDNVIVVMKNGKTIKTDMERCKNVNYSQNRAVACFINEDDALVVVKNGKLVKTGIEGASDIEISACGDTIAYFTDTEGNYGTLNLYYTKNGKKKEIEDEVLIGSAVLSPNGETVAFVGDYEAWDDFKGYYSIKGKKPVEVGKEKRVFAIADKAEYLYYVDDDRVYAKKKKKEAEKLASDLYGVKAFLNADCTEILLLNDGKTYISVKADEKQKVSNESFSSIILPYDSVQAQMYQSTQRGSIEATFTGADTFKEQVFYAGGRLVYVNKKCEGSTLASSIMDYAIADDCESLVYLTYGGDVVRVKDFDKGGKETQIGSKDAEAEELYAGGSLKYVYYMNSDEELCCIKGKKTKKIADDITSAAISADGRMCYYVVEDETLYYSKNAGKGKEIDSSEDGIECAQYYDKVLVEIERDDETVGGLMDGKSMKEILKME